MLVHNQKLCLWAFLVITTSSIISNVKPSEVMDDINQLDKKNNIDDHDNTITKDPSAFHQQHRPPSSATTSGWGRVSDTDSHDNESNASSSSNSGSGDKKVPFVPPKTPGGAGSTTQIPIDPHSHHQPPEGFTITARVYTDSSDRLAHFSDTADDPIPEIILPYWDCGLVGSTTAALPIKDAYFRHALGSVHPNVWSGTEYGPHPQLLVPLKKLEVSLNSGSTRIFEPGDVVLLEDVMSPGHKIRAASDNSELSALLLTLPQHYHHIGKDRISLTSSGATKRMNRNGKQKPCPPGTFASADNDDEGSKTLITADAVPAFLSRHRSKIFGAAGLSLSSALTFLLMKVSPLILAAGFGGSCLIAGGTYGTIVLGEKCTESIETLIEKRKLEGTTTSTTAYNEDGLKSDAIDIDNKSNSRLRNDDNEEEKK